MAQSPHNSVTLKVRVQPNASRDQVVGYVEDTLRLQVAVPPQGGKANAAVVSLLAKALGVTKSRVQIVRGHASREKLVVVESLSAQEVDHRLSTLAG